MALEAFDDAAAEEGIDGGGICMEGIDGGAICMELSAEEIAATARWKSSALTVARDKSST